MSDEQNDLDVTDPLAVAGQVNPSGPIPKIDFERIDTPPRAVPQQQQQPQVVVLQQGRQRREQPPRDKPQPKTPLQAALPNPERVKIGRRRPDGHVAHIGYYSWADVARYRSVEAFLSTTLVPTYGGGEYELSYVKPDGNEDPARTIMMEGAPQQPTTTVTPLDQVVRLAQQLRDDAARTAPPQTNPVQQLQELMALQKQMGGGNDSMLMMMAMQAMQKLRTETEKVDLEGTAVSTTLTLTAIKSAEQVAKAEEEGLKADAGIGGFLAKQMFKKAAGDPADPRTMLLTSAHELLRVTQEATAADVALPAGFKPK